MIIPKPPFVSKTQAMNPNKVHNQAITSEPQNQIGYQSWYWIDKQMKFD